MKRFAFLPLALLAGSALWASTSHAATTGSASVTLAAQANALVDVLDPTLTLAPTSADYANDYVVSEGVPGLHVRVKTNSTTGLVLKVRCPDATPQIALADFLVRTQTAAGSGGTTLASYTAISGTDQTLWTAGVAQHTWATISTDIKIQNLFT